MWFGAMARFAPDIRTAAAWRDGKAASWARAGLKIGLFGGSFNPAHGGHRHVAVSALTLLRLDAVIWLVAPQNPLKTTDDMADYDRRMASAQSVARHPRMHVSDMERRHRCFYTAETIRLWRQQYPRARFVWLMGGDSFLSFHRWKDWRDIMNAVPVAILPRPGASLAAAKARAGRQMAHAMVSSNLAARLPDMAPPAWTVLTAELDKRSATAIRARGGWP
jgi:nicotinate-nucleotide adenylyltransferase